MLRRTCSSSGERSGIDTPCCVDLEILTAADVWVRLRPQVRIPPKFRPTDIQILGGQAELQLVNLNDVVDVQLPASARLLLAVHPNRHAQQKRLDFSTAVDDPFELEQLTEADCLAPDPNIAPHHRKASGHTAVESMPTGHDKSVAAFPVELFTGQDEKDASPAISYLRC